MTAVMLVAALPTAAYAAVGDLVRRSAVENAALLAALEEVYGDDAEAYLAVLEQYGLLDEDGNFVTDEKIVMDGQAYTLDEIEAILEDPATDLTKVVEVDGTYLTLADLKTVVEIERYLAYLKDAYFTKQDLTREQVASFYDLADAWASGEMQMILANALSGVGPAGVDHSVRLTVDAADTASENGTYTVTATLNKVQTKDVTFYCRALEGNIPAEVTTVQVGDDKGKISNDSMVTIPAGETKVTLTVKVGENPWYIKDGDKCHGMKKAGLHKQACFLVDPIGIEPTTLRMRTVRSRKVVSFLPMDYGVWFDKNIGRVDIILHLTGISREIEFVPDRD